MHACRQLNMTPSLINYYFFKSSTLMFSNSIECMHCIYYDDSNYKIIIIIFLVFGLGVVMPYILELDGVLDMISVSRYHADIINNIRYYFGR